MPRNTENAQVWDLFPESIDGTLYGYDQSGYYLETVPGTGKGYWLKFWEPGSASIYGEPFYEMTLELSSGWNLIAGLSETVTYNGMYDPEGILIEGTLYRYAEGGYEMENVIAPGNGYWIKTFESGTITLYVTEELAKVDNQEYLISGTNQLKINGQTLYFGTKLSETKMESFSLPPTPPEGGVDVRFSGDTKLCSTSECLIEIMNDEHLVTFEFDIKNGERWEIIDESGRVFKCESVQILESSGNIKQFILRKETLLELPSEFSILYAFPNPFNPVTTINFTLPITDELHIVNLQVFDITGKLIDNLVEGEYKSGVHSIHWDASGSPSGIYFVHLNTNNFIQTQKIVLMK